MRKESVLRRFMLSCIAVGMVSCSTTRYVPQGSFLLGQVKVRTDEKNGDINTSAMKNYVRQTPNSKWFSLVKLPLFTYSLAGRDSSKWLNRTLRSMGEAPVIFDSVQTILTRADLRQELQNQGYMHANVSVITTCRGEKKKDVLYLLSPGQPYFLHSIRYVIDDSAIEAFMRESGDSLQRLIKVGQKFDARRLDDERSRITQLLANQGYSRFHKEFISYDADTVRDSRMIDLTLHLRLFERSSLPDTLHTRYTIGNITYASGDPDDKVVHLRHHVLEECTHISPGHLFSARDLQNTYNHFGRLQAVKYTNIAFSQRPDTAVLDCGIRIQTNKPSTLSFQPEGTNTAGDLGAAESLTYQNRNLFRGSEVFSMELRGAYEAIRGLEGYQNQDFLEYSAEARLAFPRFVAPFFMRNSRQVGNATSEVSLLFDMQNRPEFHRRVLSAAWRYKWNKPNRHDRYQLDLLDLNYVFMPWLSETFRREYLES